MAALSDQQAFFRYCESSFFQRLFTPHWIYRYLSDMFHTLWKIRIRVTVNGPEGRMLLCLRKEQTLSGA